jgi:hypothetical protein
MLEPATIFSYANLLAMAGWLGVIAALFLRSVRPVVWTGTQLIVPAILSTAYVLLLWQGRSAFDEGGFGSIEQVRALFADDSALAAGWLHYLAFDLFVGAWIARDGDRTGVPALLILPCLPLTFLFGPAGLLLYLALRPIFRNPQPESAQ